MDWMLIMKNSWNIFSKDIKNIGTNWVAAIIIGGLILLPSLYAWLNIKASWDPYGQTDQIPIGVVNEDAGETVLDEDINVGDTLVDTLKENDSMQWHFVSKDLAIDKLENGDYFAVIVIPDDFSKNLGTVINAHPEKAHVEYYVNEKLNAIAPKITEKGASVIVEDVSSEFISTVNGVIFDIFNNIGLELEADLPDIEQFEDYIFTIEKKLPEIHETLKGTLSDADEASGIVSKAQKEIPKVKDVVGNGMTTIDETNEFLGKAEQQINEMGPKIKEDLAKAQETVAKFNTLLDDVDSTDINFDEGRALKERLGEKVDESLEFLNDVETTLEAVLEQMQNADEPDQDQIDRVGEAIDKVQHIQAVLNEGRENTEELDQFIDEKKGEVDEIFANIKEISENAGTGLDELVKEYNESIEPTVLEELTKAQNTLSEGKDILVDIQSTIPEVEKLLKRTGGSLNDGKGLLEDVLAEYPYVNDKVNELANKIRDVKDEADINEIIDLLLNDPETEKGFFAEPVKLDEHSLFPIENYGSGMTPFYTVLSLWVGGLLLISLLTTDVHRPEPEQFNSQAVYFGKLFTFAFIGLLQTIIVTTGDIFLINVQMANPVWFVIFGLFCSLVFITIIYTLVSIFGDVGKALAIVMLVLQIAGSGGTYPVVLLPKFFQTISPFLPFTYAVDIMREAVGGIVWSNVIFDLIILAFFGLIAILFGTLLKKPINKHTNKLVEKSQESGVFH